MSTDKATLVRWTEEEKNSLLLSIIECSGPINWNQVKIPEGRTMGGCRFLFGQMKKAWEGPGHKRTRGGQTIPMAKGAAKAKGAPKPKEVAKEKGAAKRKRGRSNGDTVALEDDDEEILQVKKMKTESEAEEIGGEIKEESTTELSDGGVEI